MREITLDQMRELLDCPIFHRIGETADELGVEATALQDVLGGAGFEYNAEQNRFW
jgi:hypothetical protein